MRSVFEHGLHGLHGFFLEDVDIPLSSVMRRGVLNTDCTDSFYWGILRMDLWSHCEEAQNYP